MSNTSQSKSVSKKTNSVRERDKHKGTTSESGGSSQCDTPPLVDKDSSTSVGKYAGISPESILCMSEQVGSDITIEAATNMAEDVTYKLRQVISTLALHSEMLKKTQVDSSDVNRMLMLSDTSPVMGTVAPHYVAISEEKICCQLEGIQNVMECAMTPQECSFASVPSLSVEWITDDKSLGNPSSSISPQLQNYYTRVARAILNLKKKLKDVAVKDLATNTRIGPIFPNLFNLAVLVLNDDNLKALNVPAKKPLQSNVLDMVDALCSNPCSLDTNIQQQFQRLFPVMVSNILGNGSLSEKMVNILKKITRTWPSFITLGNDILSEYLSQGSKERMTGPMIKCISALGRTALVDCLSPHLDYIDLLMHAPKHSQLQPGIRETVLESSSCLLRAEPTTYLEDYVTTDYTMYEMLGDSVLPRRIYMHTKAETKTTDKTAQSSMEDDFIFIPHRTGRTKLKLTTRLNKHHHKTRTDQAFEPTDFKTEHIFRKVKIKIKGSRERPTTVSRIVTAYSERAHNVSSHLINVPIAGGLLNRFRYKIEKRIEFPTFGNYLL